MINLDTTLAWKYHDLTKHSYWSIRAHAHYLDWPNQPSPFKIYPALEPIPLPTAFAATGIPALAAIASDADPTPEVTLNIEQLGSLLFHSAGVTRKKVGPGRELYFPA